MGCLITISNVAVTSRLRKSWGWEYKIEFIFKNLIEKCIELFINIAEDKDYKALKHASST